MYLGLATFLLVFGNVILADYWADRAALIDTERSMSTGGSLELNEKEKIVNAQLMAMKFDEIERGFADPSQFAPAFHFFDSVKLVEQSRVFSVLKTVPKGGSLHGHDTALVSYEYLYNLTFSDNLYACILPDDRLNLHFFEEPVSDDSCEWTPIQVLRDTVNGFEDLLRGELTLVRQDHAIAYDNINKVWAAFGEIFRTTGGLICYKPVFYNYFYRVLEELYEDNVMYMEFRTTLPTVYDLTGKEYGPVEVAGIYKEVADDFLSTHRDFLGVKLIYAPVRKVGNEVMDEYIRIMLSLRQLYPDFVAGFDLVGQEDLGRPLVDFVTQLKTFDDDVKFFFHSGETNWYGTTTDENLIDAILLGTKRIGHGYALVKHPEIMRLVKENGIAIEVCPISNQVLKLVSDMRNHPANYFFANGYPVVVCNDDPSFWGSKALSHDWYMAFMGMSAKQADLKFLKQLAINSLIYSEVGNKTDALIRWRRKWDEFIDATLCSFRQVDPIVLV